MAQLEHIEAIEKRLWSAADTLRESGIADRRLVLNRFHRAAVEHSFLVNVDDAIDALMNVEASVGVRAQDVAALRAAVDSLVPANQSSDGDVTAPQMTVYENKNALRSAAAAGDFSGDSSYMLGDDTGEITYVFPGKAYYTYYCYTNSTSPAIMVDAHDIAGTSARVSYPTIVSMDTAGTNSSGQPRTRSGLVKSGWMQYTTDAAGDANTSGRNADYEIMTRSVSNPYQNQLNYFGRDFSKGIFAENDDSGYEYYTHEQYVLLKPTFVNDGTKQYALYTFEVRDDSYNNLESVNEDTVPTGLPADSALLAGAGDFADYATDGADLSATSNANITPVNTITIYVEYFNSMNGYDGDAGGQRAADGVGTYNDNALEVYTKFRENSIQDNLYVNVDYLYRNAGGAATTDFINPQFKTDNKYEMYIATDPFFGNQSDVGSFYYLMESDDPATAAYWDAYDRYLEENPSETQAARAEGAAAAMSLVKKTVSEKLEDPSVIAKMNSTWFQAASLQLGDFVHWPYNASTEWYSQFYAPATCREETLVFVHIYDRWGNHYTNILQRDLQDNQAARALSASRGTVTVNEIGGSGVRNISITELNTDKVVPVSGMTDDGSWNVVNNQFTISGLPKGNNDYNYTMTITDNAGSDYTENFRASSDGTVVVTVNDETMGGSYAAAAAAPAADSQGTESVNGIGPVLQDTEEADLTMLSIEEVQPDVIAVDTIEEAQIAQAAAEDRPDLYTFTLNEIYTVNLFADAARDYSMTLKSTVGGILKAYINGVFSPVKQGKVVVPAGSQVQIRVSSRAGYMLTDLTMQYSDGRTVNLVGAYNAEINDDVTVKAIFQKTDALLKVSVENGAVSGKSELQVSPYSRVAVVAKAAPEGKVFAYWAQDDDDDVPVSFDSIYTFIVTSNVKLKAIYAEAPTEKTAGIVMDAKDDTHVSVVNGMYTLSYSGKITVPDDAMIEDFGLLLTNQSADDCTEDNFVIGGQVNGVNVAKISGQTMTEEGQCKINVNNVKAGQTRTGRLYLIVKLADGSTQTIYSNSWSELNTPAAE